ncbi:MAG: hypothetical protein GY913_03625 [Proteobacteria bacterium]|nr:hypothetical protein [Pseudomonadota bacterium]MCP4915991.1 hypothetical protein [Pseudomonadota bacterium]
MILWSTLALATPGNLTSGGEPYQPNTAEYVKERQGTRFAVELTDDGENRLVSPLVSQGGQDCDGDEYGIGDPDTPLTAKNLDWCPKNDIKNDDPEVPTQLLSHERTFDLGAGGEWPSAQLHGLLAQPLKGVMDVWQAGHYSVAENDARLPCPVPSSKHGTEALNQDEDGNPTTGLDPDGGVVVGWFRLPGAKSCAIKYVNKRYTFADDCRTPGAPGEAFEGDLELFSFKRDYAGNCSRPDASLDPYWALRITLKGELPAAEETFEEGEDACHNELDDDEDGAVDCDDDGCSDLESCADSSEVPLLPLLLLGAVLCLGVPLLLLGALIKWLAKKTVVTATSLGGRLQQAWDWAAGALRGRFGSPAPEEDETGVEQVSILTLSYATEDVVRRSWADLAPNQRKTLLALATGNVAYLRNVQMTKRSRVPVRLFAETSHERDWNAATQSLKDTPMANWGDAEELAATAWLLATLRAEAKGFDTATHSRPSTNGVLFTYLMDAVGYTMNVLRAAQPGGVHAAIDLCQAVTRVLGRLDLIQATSDVDTHGQAATEAPKTEKAEVDLDVDQGDVDDGTPRPLAPSAPTAAASSTELKAAKAANVEYQRELRRKERQVSELKKDKAQLTTERDHAKTAKATADSDAGALRVRVGKLSTRVSELEAQVTDYEKQLADLLGEAEQRRQEEERKNKARSSSLERDDSQFLLACIKQAQRYIELRAAVGRIADLSANPGLAQTLKSSEALLKYAEKGGVRKDYLAAWRDLDGRVRKQVKGLQAFARAAELLRKEKDPEKLVQTLIRQGGPYSVEGHLGEEPQYWGDGFQAWKTLYRLAQNEQGDNGKALGVTVSHEVFGQVLVPWLQLSQLLGEAVPVELKSAQVGKMAATKRLSVRAPAAELFDKLGYKYEHVELYTARRTDFQQRRKLVATSSVEAAQVYLDQPAPPEIEHDVVVRVHQPLIVDGPRSVRAQIWCLDLEG